MHPVCNKEASPSINFRSLHPTSFEPSVSRNISVANRCHWLKRQSSDCSCHDICADRAVWKEVAVARPAQISSGGCGDRSGIWTCHLIYSTGIPGVQQKLQVSVRAEHGTFPFRGICEATRSCPITWHIVIVCLWFCCRNIQSQPSTA